MTEATIRQHGLERILQQLAKTSTVNTAINVEVLANLSHTNLRGDLADDRFGRTAEVILNHSLEIEANTFATIADRRIYWLGPDERLLLSPNDDDNHLLDEMTSELLDSSCAVNDLSGGQIVLRLSGNGVVELLAKGCTLDLHKNVFLIGMCMQTGLAKANVLLSRVADDTYELIVRRSFSEYLVKWLAHAGRDVGIQFGIGRGCDID